MAVHIADLDDDIVNAFWAKVHKWGGQACWQWRGGLHSRGYGKVVIAGKQRLANHVAWVLENGELPHNHVLTPKCNNRSCVRPDHWDCVSRHLASRRTSGAYSDFKAFEELGDARFHMKLGEDLRNAGSSQSRLERMVSELVAASERRQHALDEALVAIRDAAGVPEKSLEALREEIVGLKETVELLVPSAPAAATDPAPPPRLERATEQTPESLGDALVRVFRRSLPEAEVDQAELLTAFDLALGHAGGNGEGALHTFSAWTMELAERVKHGDDRPGSDALLALAQRAV